MLLAEAKFGTLGTVGLVHARRSPPAKYKGAGVGPSPAYSYSAAVVEVEVDPRHRLVAVPRSGSRTTSAARSTRCWSRGQVEGSVYMGLGEALMEEQAFRRLPPKLSNALVHKFPSMLEYKSPTTLEMPEVVTYLVEDPIPNGPFGAKEVGQGPLLPVMPAVANAVFDAVGVRVDEVPITPERVAEGAGRSARRGRRSRRRFGPARFPRRA